MNEDMLRPIDVAEILGVTLPTIRRWIANNHMPHYKLSPGVGRSGCVRVSAEDLQEWLRLRRHGPSHDEDEVSSELCLPGRHSPLVDRRPHGS